MMEPSVLYKKKNHTGWITLNRPHAGNSFDVRMAQELTEICSQINGDQEVNAVFLTGAGEIFCLGGDSSLSRSKVDIISPSECVGALNRPAIAVINGGAIGLGLEMALACDLRLAADTSSFGLPQITRGDIPMDGGTQRLSRIVGKAKALEMILTGEILDAQAAYEAGLVNKVVKASDLASESETMAVNLAGKAPFALCYAKEAVNAGLDLTLEQGLRLEANLYFLLHTTSDRTEGIQSFLHKRKPVFKGK
jgi:enoyl-CoA hydratase/carnithine racemase